MSRHTEAFLSIDGPSEELRGTIRVSGSKNSTLPILAATLLVPGIHQLSNVPDIVDVRNMIVLLIFLGCECDFDDASKDAVTRMTIDSTSASADALSKNPAKFDELFGKLRGGIHLIAPMLIRFGFTRMPVPGGCAIGTRPVNFLQAGLHELGVEWKDANSAYVGSCPERLPVGASVRLPLKSLSATVALILAASRAKGNTTISNAAVEPETLYLIEFLAKCGFRIDVNEADNIITVNGRPGHRSHNCTICHTIPGDRMEGGTILMLVAATGGDVTLTGLNPKGELDALIEVLQEMGCRCSFPVPSSIRLQRHSRKEPLRSIPRTKIDYHPGFPTDLQPQLTALMCRACIESGSEAVIEEIIWVDRTTHVPWLRSMGANINSQKESASCTKITVRTGSRMFGAPVRGEDLRCAAALIIGGLIAEGRTEVHNIERTLDRGYETNFVEKLQSLGASIHRAIRIPCDDLMDENYAISEKKKINNRSNSATPPHFDLICDVPLAPNTTLRVGGTTRFFLKVSDALVLPSALAWARRTNTDIFVLGGGSKVVFSDEGLDGLTILMKNTGLEELAETTDRVSELVENEEKLDTGPTPQDVPRIRRFRVQVGNDWDDFVSWCVTQQLTGVECLSGIPSSLGGAVLMNIGAYGCELDAFVEAVHVVERATGGSKTIEGKDCGFSYRHSNFKTIWKDDYIIVAVDFAFPTLCTGGSIAPSRLHPHVRNYLDRVGNFHPSPAEVRQAVLAIRKTKSMLVTDRSDKNHRTVGSFFLNPILDTQAMGRLRIKLHQAGITSDLPCRSVSRAFYEGYSKLTVPLPSKTDGREFFQVPAGWFIEQGGFWKGYSLSSPDNKKTAALSSKHCNSVVNLGEARTQEIVALTCRIRDEVELKFGVCLFPEAVLVGCELVRDAWSPENSSSDSSSSFSEGAVVDLATALFEGVRMSTGTLPQEVLGSPQNVPTTYLESPRMHT